MELKVRLSFQRQQDSQTASLAESPIITHLWEIPLNSHLLGRSVECGTELASVGFRCWNELYRG
jgi:hypothetical protein